jgi:hypothetical protein
MAAADVLAFTDSWTRSTHGSPIAQCPSSAPLEYSLHRRLSLIACAWVVQRLNKNVCFVHWSAARIAILHTATFFPYAL